MPSGIARPNGARRGGALCAAALAAAAPAMAATHTVAPGGDRLARTLDRAAAGDVVVLGAGVHRGPVHLRRPVVLRGEAGAIVDGGGRGSVIVATAPGIRIEGLIVRNSGASLEAMDAGIKLEKGAGGAVVAHNRLTGNLFGIYLLGPKEARVRRNVVIGRRDLRENERGNGIQLWNTPGSRIVENDILYGRDGIFVETSRHNRFIGNRMRDLRFAVHYMYTNRSAVRRNISIGNDIGFAIMYSRRIEVTGNLSRGDREHGLLLNFANRSSIARNTVLAGPKKCVFIYNANRNRFRDNRFGGCRIGIHFTAGSERNALSGNAFLGNRQQVKYVGTRSLDWSRDGRGNYWSDHAAFDLNGDGIADAPYRPNGIVDRIVWTHPSAKILLNSPATRMLRWAQSHFPAIYPGGVVDSAPLMRAVQPARPTFWRE